MVEKRVTVNALTKDQAWENWEKSGLNFLSWVVVWIYLGPIPSMGLVYLPIHENHKKSTIHVGKYTSPMDGMGYDSLIYTISLGNIFCSSICRLKTQALFVGLFFNHISVCFFLPPQNPPPKKNRQC